MEEINKDKLIENMIYSMNGFKDEVVKSMNYIREDIRDLKCELKGEIQDLRQELRDYKEENNRRWDENDKRWEENERRWKENDERWKENQKNWEENKKKWAENEQRWAQNEQRWAEYRENREKDRKQIIDIFHNYDISISTQLGDPNAEKMRKIV